MEGKRRERGPVEIANGKTQTRNIKRTNARFAQTTAKAKKAGYEKTCLFCFFMFMMKRLAPCGGAFLYENSIKADCGEGLSGR